MTRVLVFGMSNRKAGTETVINTLVSIAPREVVFDYITFEPMPDWPTATANGGDVIVLPNKHNSPIRYEIAIRKFFKQNAAKYDFVWSNLNILHNIDVLKLGYKYGIPRRILHAHNSMFSGKLHTRLLCAANRLFFDFYLTDRWACSSGAGRFFFGDKPFTLVPNAIQMSKYAYNEKARERLRRALNIDDKFVIGTVGSLVYQKNQELLIRCMPVLLSRNANAHLLIVGQGELEGGLRNLAISLGVDHCVTFTGQRKDVADLLSAFDVFAFPSHYEGFSVVLLEAQANGLPCVISNTIADDPVISEGCSIADVNDEAVWVEKLLCSSRKQCKLIPEKAQQYDLKYQAILLRELFS